MEKKNKIWAKPALTVLVRRKPEEGILEVCKQSSVSGPVGADSECLVISICVGPCESLEGS